MSKLAAGGPGYLFQVGSRPRDEHGAEECTELGKDRKAVKGLTKQSIRDLSDLVQTGLLRWRA